MLNNRAALDAHAQTRVKRLMDPNLIRRHVDLGISAVLEEARSAHGTGVDTAVANLVEAEGGEGTEQVEGAVLGGREGKMV